MDEEARRIEHQPNWETKAEVEKVNIHSLFPPIDTKKLFIIFFKIFDKIVHYCK